jgi:hypothetical protein
MADLRERLLQQALAQLAPQAAQRPDLLSASQGGPSFGSPEYRAPGQQAPFTYLGRVAQPGESLESLLTRFPAGEIEAATTTPPIPGMPTVGAVISPMAWKNTSAEARAMLTNVFNRRPELARQVLESPYDLQANVVSLSQAQQRYGMQRPPLGYFEPGSAGGPGTLTVQSRYARGEKVPVHELGHFLTQEHVAKMDLTDAARVARFSV